MRNLARNTQIIGSLLLIYLKMMTLIVCKNYIICQYMEHPILLVQTITVFLMIFLTQMIIHFGVKTTTFGSRTNFIKMKKGWINTT